MLRLDHSSSSSIPQVLTYCVDSFNTIERSKSSCCSILMNDVLINFQVKHYREDFYYFILQTICCLLTIQFISFLFQFSFNKKNYFSHKKFVNKMLSTFKYRREASINSNFVILIDIRSTTEYNCRMLFQVLFSIYFNRNQ